MGKPVISVLVGGAAMPAPETLPASLRPLTRLQALSMSDRHWQADVGLLLQQLRLLVPGLPQGTGVAGDREGTPAQALGELARLLQEQLDQRTRNPGAAPAAGRPPPQLLRWLARQLRGWTSSAAVLVMVYLGLRLFADAQTLAQLDSLEARLLTAWQRLRAHGP